MHPTYTYLWGARQAMRAHGENNRRKDWNVPKPFFVKITPAQGLAFALTMSAILLFGMKAAFAERYPITAFSNLPNMEFPSLSPDGTHIAFLRPVDGKRALFVRRRGASDSESLHLDITAKIDFNIDWFQWVSNRYLIVAANFTGRRGRLDTVETRLLTVSRTGATLRSLELNRGSFQPQVQTDVIDLLQDSPNELLLSMEANSRGRVDAFRLSVRSGRLRTVERGTADTQRWVTDRAGNIRIRTDIVGTQKIVNIKPVDGDWRILRQFDFFADPDFEPHSFADDDTLLVVSTHENGRRGVYTFSISQDRFVDRLFLQPDVDVLSLARYRNGELWGFHYANDRFLTAPLRQSGADRTAKVDALLPDTFNLQLNNNAARRFFLFHSSTASDPGTYYLFDNDSGRVREIGKRYPALDPSKLAAVAPFKFKARDGLDISAYVTLPVGASLSDKTRKWPVVVMPHGGPRSRDYPSFDYMTHFLANRRYAVLRINFRGSLGYGRAFEARGYREWGNKIQNDITDGFRALVSSGFADPDRACIMGGSFGGYSAIMAAARWPDLYRCAASLNGAMDLLRFAEFAQSYRFAALVDHRLGSPRRDADLLRRSSPLNLANQIQIPVLLIHSEDDRRVRPAHSRDMHAALQRAGKEATLIIIPDGDHSLSRAAFRQQYLSEVEKFLARHLAP